MIVRTIPILALVSWTNSIGNVHEEIVKWWKDISTTKPYKCHANHGAYDFVTSPKIANFMEDLSNVPYIVALACSKYGMVPSDNYVFKGNVTNGQIVGLGKLKFVTNSLDGDNSEEKSCFINNKNVQEVVGTFVNGTLEGPAKVTLSNSRVILSNFVNGSPFGPTRTWKANDEILHSYSYQAKRSSMSIGRKWIRYKEMLIWTSESSYVQDEDKELWSILVPMNVSEDIVAGKYNSLTGMVDQVHSVDVKITNQSKDCLLSLTTKILDPKDYMMSLTKDGSRKILLNQHITKPLCNFFENSGKKNLRENFSQWERLMTNITINHGLLNAFEVLHYVKPENSRPKIGKGMKSFISNLTLFTSESKMLAKLSIWEGVILPWEIQQFGLNNEGNLHGTCKLTLDNEYVDQTGTIEFFPWSINFITGRFLNGLLDGVVILGTWQGTILFVTFKEGILHGPSYGIIRQPIYDIWVSYHYKK